MAVNYTRLNQLNSKVTNFLKTYKTTVPGLVRKILTAHEDKNVIQKDMHELATHMLNTYSFRKHYRGDRSPHIINEPLETQLIKLLKLPVNWN